MSFYEDVSEVCSTITDNKNKSDSVSFFEDETEVLESCHLQKKTNTNVWCRPHQDAPVDFDDGVEEEEEKEKKPLASLPKLKFTINSFSGGGDNENDFVSNVSSSNRSYVKEIIHTDVDLPEIEENEDGILEPIGVCGENYESDSEYTEKQLCSDSPIAQEEIAAPPPSVVSSASSRGSRIKLMPLPVSNVYAYSIISTDEDEDEDEDEEKTFEDHSTIQAVDIPRIQEEEEKTIKKKMKMLTLSKDALDKLERVQNRLKKSGNGDSDTHQKRKDGEICAEHRRERHRRRRSKKTEPTVSSPSTVDTRFSVKTLSTISSHSGTRRRYAQTDIL